MSSESVCWVTEQNSLFILETEKYFNLLVNQYKVHEAGWLRDYKNILYQYAVVSGLPSCLFYKCTAVDSVKLCTAVGSGKQLMTLVDSASV